MIVLHCAFCLGIAMNTVHFFVLIWNQEKFYFILFEEEIYKYVITSSFSF
jgi:hypothetical protein